MIHNFKNKIIRATKSVAKVLSDFAKLSAIILSLIAFGATSYAQLTGKKVDEQSLIINRINYKIEGPKSISEDAITAHVRLRKGMKFDQKSLDQSIRSLYQTGLYDVIDATRSMASNGQMDIDFLIVPKYRISQIVFKGNKEFSARRIQEEITSYAGSTLSEVQVKRDADKIKEFYQKKRRQYRRYTQLSSPLPLGTFARRLPRKVYSRYILLGCGLPLSLCLQPCPTFLRRKKALERDERR